MSIKAIDVNSRNFKKEVLTSDIPVAADFWAEWCMPCRMIGPIIDELSAEYSGTVKFVKVNVDDAPELATELQILSIPVLILFKNGKELRRIQGANTKEYIEKEIDRALTK